jgi:hypothetical protein
MASPSLIAPVEVVLDRPRVLRFTRGAVRQVELDLTRLWGRDYTFYEAIRRLSEMLLDNDLSKLSYLNIATLLWRGCQHEDPGVTLEQIEEGLPYADPSGLIPYVGLILQAWNNATPTAPASGVSEAAERDPLDGSTGAASGALSAPALA